MKTVFMARNVWNYFKSTSLTSKSIKKRILMVFYLFYKIVQIEYILVYLNSNSTITHQ